MKRLTTATLLALLASATIAVSAIPILVAESRRLGIWRSADPSRREELLFLHATRLIREARVTVEPDSRILLFSSLDPGLVPYYLHPRRIFQINVRPETDDLYMQLPPPDPPARAPESFDCQWWVRLDTDAHGEPATHWRRRVASITPSGAATPEGTSRAAGASATMLLALAAIVAAGLLLAGLLDRGRPLLTLFPEGFALGSLALFELFLVVDPTRGWRDGWTVALFAAIVVSFVSLRGWRRIDAGVVGLAGEGPPFGRLDRWTLVAIGLLAAGAASSVLFEPLVDWDARILWALKAKFLFEEPSLATAPFRDPYLLHIHPRYPLLLPWTVALLSRCAGRFSEGSFQAATTLAGILAIVVIHQTVARRVSRSEALLAALLAAASGIWIESVASCRVELVLLLFTALAFEALVDGLEPGEALSRGRAGVFLAGAALTKDEGVALALAAAVAFLVADRAAFTLRGRARRLAELMIPFALLYVPWLLQVRQIPNVSTEDYVSRVASGAFLAALPRFGEVALSIASRLLDPSKWGFLWIAAAASCALLAHRRELGAAERATAIFGGFYLALIAAVFVVSPWRVISNQIEVGANRILMPLLPALILLVARAAAASGGGGARQSGL